jgi:hypothetical protein
MAALIISFDEVFSGNSIRGRKIIGAIWFDVFLNLSKLVVP